MTRSASPVRKDLTSMSPRPRLSARGCTRVDQREMSAVSCTRSSFIGLAEIPLGPRKCMTPSLNRFGRRGAHSWPSERPSSHSERSTLVVDSRNIRARVRRVCRVTTCEQTSWRAHSTWARHWPFQSLCASGEDRSESVQGSSACECRQRSVRLSMDLFRRARGDRDLRVGSEEWLDRDRDPWRDRAATRRQPRPTRSSPSRGWSSFH